MTGVLEPNERFIDGNSEAVDWLRESLGGACLAPLACTSALVVY